MKKTLDIENIYHAFLPAIEIQDPRLFAGRKEEIKSGIQALLNPGGFIAILGLRGVGKSSIAHQIKLIAEGNTQLPRMLSLDALLPKKGFKYSVHYYKCDGYVKNTYDLLNRILFGDEKNPSLFRYTKAGERRLEEFKKVLSTNGKVGLMGTQISASGQEESLYKQYVSNDLIQQFRHLLGTIPKDNQDKTGFIFLIDEFDTIENIDEFASIVKACSSEYIKFGVIGIANSVSELIRGHSSIGRQIDYIHVPLMPNDELKQILDRGEFVVNNEISFASEAKELITHRSEGFPYFTHLLGREAMLYCYEQKSYKVNKAVVDEIFRSICAGKLKNNFEDMYHNAVGQSPQREYLLKLFATDDNDDINTETIYADAKRVFEISNPSQLMKQLTSPDTPNAKPVLIKVRDQYYRFSDPVFKVYARLRASKY